ncbi:hypothetical protein DFA_10094 [Cavenderia fasciculata]|uniref:THH1/TOM1/TOM3 domain-containing protein n=1 Tax=Cavenderia fasciculata TaxID=261658 RepID=F4Q991_CACFS|nr:uncharacterized protein DFA_10094 [Cavenderia fasciculata]EGG15260.1 hypothetical protein DFA_10094 [Cavenderia fasciculata]|eukprot:XP_004351980.1 hypothetical protein DFA_10094 [Cavenderia fasciculata]
MSEEGIDRTQCYCDPVASWGFDCDEAGCRAYAAVFFVVFLASTVEGFRRLWIQRRMYKKASFISTTQLTIGSLFFTLRHIEMMAKVREVYSLSFFLLFGFGFFISAYLFILLAWCDIITAVNFSKTIQRVFPGIKWTIIILNIILFIGWIIAMAIWWPFWMTNIFLGFYGFGVSIGYLVIGLIIWLEFKKVSDISAHGQLAKATYIRMKAVARLSVVVVITAIIFTIAMVSMTYWPALNDKQHIRWLFINRVVVALFNYAMLVCWKPTNDKDMQKSGSAWSAKMKNMDFVSGEDKTIATNAMDTETGATFTSGEEQEPQETTVSGTPIH